MKAEQALSRGAFVMAMSVTTAIAIYLPIALFPYMRADDTFLIRSNHFQQVYDALHVVNLRFAHIVFAKLLDQGRPLFWLTVNATAYLYDQYGLESLMIVRVAGIVVLALFGYSLSRYLLDWKFSLLASICLTALTMALPGIQIVMGNGVWLILPLWWAMLAGGLLRTAMEETSLGRKRIEFVCVVALVLAGLCFYQTLAFFFAALAAVPLASGEWTDRRAYVVRFIVTTVVIMVGCTVVYYGGWVFLDKVVITGIYGNQGSGYAPGAVFGDFGKNLSLFMDRRIPQVLNLWMAPYISRPLAAIVAGGVAAIWTMVFVTDRGRLRGNALKLLLYAGLFLTTESILLMTDRYADFASRYTTSICQSFIVLVFFADTANRARELASRLIRRDHFVYSIGAFALTLACCIKAEAQMLSLIVLPSSLETRFVATKISDYLKSHDRLDEVWVLGRTTPLFAEGMLGEVAHPEKFGEYTFGNLNSHGYMQYLARNLVREISGQEPTRVLTKVSGTESDFIYPGRILSADSADHRLVIDTSELAVYWRP